MALAPHVARADDVLISLDYQSDPALSGCPDGQEFRAGIIRHLGTDPFRDPAAHHLVVRISSAGPRIEGRVEWRDTSDQWEGERTFSARNESCDQMVRAMALATAIQIQLLALAAPPGSPEPPTVDALPPEPVTAPVVPAVVMPSPRESRVGIEAGLAFLSDLGGAEATLAPRLAVSLGRPSSLLLRLAASGFGPSVHVTAHEGSAQVDRLLVTLQLAHFFRAGRRLQPFVTAGGGFEDIRVHGISAMPALGEAHDGQSVVALAAAGGGLALSFAPGLFVLLEAQATLYRPDVTIQIGTDTTAARFDGEGLLLHAGLLARF